MKHIYNQMKKAIALVALFLFAGSNAWAESTWVPTNSDGAASTFYGKANKWQTITGTPVEFYSPENKPYDGSAHGIKFRYGQKAFFRTNNANGGIVTLTFESAKLSNHEGDYLIYITKSNSTERLAFCYAPAWTYGYGTGSSLSFRMEKGIEYQLSGETTVFLKKVTFYQPSEGLVLEETATNIANHDAVEAAHNANKFVLAVKRTWAANTWGTMCLPINVSNSDLVKQFHTDKVYELNTSNTTENSITFTEESSYTACTPCLIFPTAQVQNPAFADSNNKITYTAANLTATAANGISFTGVLGAESIYTASTASTINLFLGTDNKLYYPSSEAAGTIKGFRAYFTIARPSDIQEVKGISIIIEDDATGIISIENDPFQENGNVYTIDGRNMGNAKNLTRGIYVKNGRKFIVK